MSFSAASFKESNTWKLVKPAVVVFFASLPIYAVILIVWGLVFITPQNLWGLSEPVTIGWGSIRFFTFTPTSDGFSFAYPFESTLVASLVTAMVVFVIQVTRHNKK